MPGMNQRGPTGRGPMTGRGLGRCNSRNDFENRMENFDVSNDQFPAFRRGGGNRQRGLRQGNRFGRG